MKKIQGEGIAVFWGWISSQTMFSRLGFDPYRTVGGSTPPQNTASVEAACSNFSS